MSGRGWSGLSARRLLFALIVGAAAALRLDELSLMEFKADEALFHSRALEIVEQGSRPYVGQRTSRGTNKPPLTYYVLALPAAVDTDPLAMAGCIALLNALAVGLTFLIGARFWDLRTGLIAAGWFLASPSAVLYSRKIWNPDLVPIVSAVALYGLLALRQRPRALGWSLLVPFALLALWQLHDAGLAMVALGLVALLAGWRRVHLGAGAAGLALAIAMMAPYLAYEQRQGWRDLTQIARIVADERGGAPRVDLRAVAATAAITGTGALDVALGDSLADFRAAAGASAALAAALQPLVAVLFLAGWLALAASLRRGASLSRRPPWLHVAPARVPDALLCLWLFIPWAMFALSGVRPWPHYFVVCYPVVFLVIARTLSRLYDLAPRLPTPRRRLAVAALSVVAVGVPLCWLGVDRQFTAYLARRGATRGDYGVVYRVKREALALAMRRGLAVTQMPPAYGLLYSYLARQHPDRPPPNGSVALFEPGPAGLPPCAGAIDVGPLRLCPLAAGRGLGG